MWTPASTQSRATLPWKAGARTFATTSAVPIQLAICCSSEASRAIARPLGWPATTLLGKLEVAIGNRHLPVVDSRVFEQTLDQKGGRPTCTEDQNSSHGG